MIRYRVQATRTLPRRWHMVMITPALGRAVVCTFDTHAEAIEQAAKLADRDRDDARRHQLVAA